MFDIAFTEMVVMAVIALIIVGPERLPRLARQVGQWIGKLQRYVNDVKSDLSRQMELDELRNIQTEVTSAARGLEESVRSTVQSTKQEFDSINTSLAGDDQADPQEPARETRPATDWEHVYEVRRTREKFRERRIERARALGRKVPRGR